ncbi:hypothetical protein, partial [Allosphingosinicella sp.]|uniref:hypothetical protein n=1 Tax=Allosphingosinicella sp. TaxID=2823234 RepID=UPI002F1AFF2E
IVREAFGDDMPYDRVRLRQGSGHNPIPMLAFLNKNNDAITLCRSLYFERHYYEDFSKAPAEAQGLLLHEMTHVWQYASLGVPRFVARYAIDLISCGFRPSLMYDYESKPQPFPKARLEAQAQMVGHYCAARVAGKAKSVAGLEPRLKTSGIYGL